MRRRRKDSLPWRQLPHLPAPCTGQTTEHAPIDVDVTFARRNDEDNSVYGGKFAFRYLQPGGWLESTDSIYADDSSLPANDSSDVYQQWEQWRGRGPPATVTLRRLKIPFGAWPAEPRLKQAGAYNLTATVEGLEGYGLLVGTQVLGWEVEELRGLFAGMRAALLNPRHCAYNRGATMFAQKPL
ncbi:hypothetical protein B0T18DRAFT_427857 [Schizothecium vesticola]|uniref:Uncharacterized protein n=1 Tax=Schizothecium vesticola TaxID=314040 RepID=A0AA40K8W8_9PEZI|nr:hypothetical protein B0T18DRAFT_427857 [Schizothecium vesticola]